MINVASIVNDPDFAQSFTALRSVGHFLNGTWIPDNVTEVQLYGVIASPTNKELKMIPEGDIAEGAMVFWCSQPIYATSATAGVGGSSDILIWREHQFRVLDVKQFQDWGYYRAIGVRLKTD